MKKLYNGFLFTANKLIVITARIANLIWEGLNISYNKEAEIDNFTDNLHREVES